MFRFRQADLHVGPSPARYQANDAIVAAFAAITNVVQFSQLLLLSGHTVGTDQSPHLAKAGRRIGARQWPSVHAAARSDAPGESPFDPARWKAQPAAIR